MNQYERQKMLAEHMAQENLLHPHRLSPLLVSFLETNNATYSILNSKMNLHTIWIAKDWGFMHYSMLCEGK